MKKFYFLIIAFLISFISVAQNISDTIQVQQRMGKVYLRNDKVLISRDLHSILNSNENSAPEVKQAKANLAPLYLFACAGGFMIGWPLGTAIGGGDPQWGLAAIGAGLVVLAIPFQIGYNKHIALAVKIYNSELKKIGISKKSLEIGLARNGIGLEIRF
jgi:hypothetical protein